MVTVTIELEGTKQTRELTGRSTVIGRSRSADIRIDHPKVSGRHARIEIAEDGTAELVDAGSKNGLQIGDGKVDRVAVTDGLAVTIGPALFTFTTGGGQARAECLQRLQLPDPDVPGISPPPARGSGLGTTPFVASGDEGALRRSPEGAKEGPPPHSPAATLMAELAKQTAKPAPVSLEIAPPPAASPLAPVVHEPKRNRRAADRFEKLVSTASAAGSLSLAVGLHVFLALLLSVSIYRNYTKEKEHPLTITLSPPKSVFIPPADPWKGEGKGIPDGERDEPKFAKRPPAPDDTSEDLDLSSFADGAALPDSEPATDARPRVASAPRPAISLSQRGAMKKIVKVEQVVDDGSWEKAQENKKPGEPVAKRVVGPPNPPVDIKPDSDPAELVRGNLEHGQQGGWKTVATMDAGEIAVVTGEYDTVQRVLDKLKVHYTLLEPKKFGGAKLSSVRVLILNCPGNLDGSGILKLRDYVNRGGWVVSTDWALSAVKEAFPGYLRNTSLSPETWVKIEEAEGAKGDPLLTDVFNFAGETPKWYLEERSYLFQVDPKAKDKVKVLIESGEMKKKWSTGCVAATFEYGRGRVLHIVSHLQQVSTDPKSHYAMYQFLANWMIQAAAATVPAEPKKK